MKSIKSKMYVLAVVLIVIGVAVFLVPRQRSFESYIQRAEEAFRGKSYRQAIELYLRALKKYPDHRDVPKVLLSIGDTYNYSMGHFEQSTKAYAMLTERFPESREGRLAFGRAAELFVKNEQYQEALLAYQGIVDHFPNETGIDEIRFQVAMMALKLKKYEPARRTLMEIVDQNPESIVAEKALYQIGDIFFVEGAYKETIQVLEVALKKYPKGELATEIKFTLANAYEDSGRPKDALDLYRNIQHLYPNPKVIEKKIEKILGRIQDPSQTLR